MAKNQTKISSLLGSSDKARDARYQAENDLRTMQQYRELCASPARMRAVQQLVKEQAALVDKTKSAEAGEKGEYAR